MKKLFVSIFLFPVLLKAETSTLASYTVQQTIEYVCANAEEVYLVWGINDWKEQDKELWPAGTYRKGNLHYTPMLLKDGKFSVKFTLRSHTLLDYVFWITKGPAGVPSDIWDVNKDPQSDYHSLALSTCSIQHLSLEEIRPKQQLSILNFSGGLFLFLILALSLAWGFTRRFQKSKPGPYKLVLGTGGATVLLLCLIRPSVSLFSWDLYYHPLTHFLKFLFAGFYDHLYMSCLTVIFIGLLFAFQKFRRVQYALACTFIFLGLLSLLCGIMNIRLVELLGKPFNARWLYYSGFLDSLDAKSAVASNVTAAYLLNVILVCLAFAALCILLIYLASIIQMSGRTKRIAASVLVLLNLGYLVTAGNALPAYNIEPDKLANPVAAFLGSVNPFAAEPQLYSMQVADSLTFSVAKKTDRAVAHHSLYAGKIKNVLLVVLESTAAEYVQPYDTLYKVTPALEKQLEHAIVFENMYAHAPATNKSMVCLLGSLYPWLSYASLTQEHPDVKIPTLSSELARAGYRTSFFNSADNRFQKAGEFLANHHFDEIKDCKSTQCANQFQEKDEKWNPLDGIDDACSAEALLSWIKKDPSKPFFSVWWTYQTHYPYYTSGKETMYVASDTILNRYLNAVNHSDRILQNILDELMSNRLDSSTLVVVIGDHGEAFGRHDQTTHASKIYEENVHIPCMFINPIFQSARKKDIGGTVDIAPSIMHILGYPAPGKWQGVDLFAVSQNRTYFFCPWSDHLFGFREGNMKYIYNATRNSTEAYDLLKDPTEQHNIATKINVEVAHQKLAGWVQYQQGYMQKLLVKQ